MPSFASVIRRALWRTFFSPSEQCNGICVVLFLLILWH
jgi:hypothetical protein